MFQTRQTQQSLDETKPFEHPAPRALHKPYCKPLLNGVVGTVAAGIYQLIIIITQQYNYKKQTNLPVAQVMGSWLQRAQASHLMSSQMGKGTAGKNRA